MPCQTTSGWPSAPTEKNGTAATPARSPEYSDPAEYGKLEFALAVMVFCSLSVDLGLSTWGAREVAAVGAAPLFVYLGGISGPWLRAASASAVYVVLFFYLERSVILTVRC